MSKHAVVVGGGICGLVTALRLAQRGWDVDLFEAKGECGGLARCIPLGDGYIERYYHFICGGDKELIALARELGIDKRLRWAPAPVGHFYQGSLYPFSTALDLLRFRPISPFSRLRVGLHAWRAQRTTDWKPLDDITAAKWLLDSVGRQAYEAIWKPLLEVKFGPYHDKISAAWLWHRIWRVGTSRRSALRPDVMGHFLGGTKTLLDALIHRLNKNGVRIHLRCPAQRLVTGGKHTVRTKMGEIDADAVILAIPLPVAAKLVRDSLPQWSQKLAAVPNIAVVCGLFRLSHNLTKYFWVNVNDPRIVFNGFIEYSNLNPSAEVWGGEIVYVPMYLAMGDERLGWTARRWAEEFKKGLSIIDSRLSEAVTFELITRDRFAQPICQPGFSRIVPSIAGPAPGIFLVEASQLYPSDRTISGMIGLANKAAELAAES